MSQTTAPLPTPRRATASTLADAEERRSFRRAMSLGLFVWPSFHLVDQYLGWFVFPSAPLWLCFALRVLGQLAIYGMYRLSYAERISRTSLKLANAAVCGLAAVLISVMGTWFGGLVSSYLHGTSLVILVLALAVPAPWRDSAWYVIAVFLSFPLVFVTMGQLRPELWVEWSDRERVGVFVGHYSIVFGAAAIALVSGQITYNARQQLRRARQLGRYRLEARIGRGGMSEVWHARDPQLGRAVALKILRSAHDADSRSVARFEREARALSQLTSEHTVRVYDFGAGDDGFAFIAMELLEGNDLQRLVEEGGPLDPPRAVWLLTQACRSLAEAHAVGLIHRDVKPANLFVTHTADGEERLKVVDFGIARRVTDDTLQTQSVQGTPAYMAPECWTGAKGDARSDVYGLGATLYYALTGQPPFAGAAVGDQLRAHLFEAPPSVAGVPAELDAIVRRCLAKSPAERYGDAAALEEALDALAGRLLDDASS